MNWKVFYQALTFMFTVFFWFLTITSLLAGLGWIFLGSSIISMFLTATCFGLGIHEL